jgi:hypothetical protein
MRGAILPFPQYVFLAWCLVKHRDNFTFFTFTTFTTGPTEQGHSFYLKMRIAVFQKFVYIPYRDVRNCPKNLLPKMCILCLCL